MHIDFTAAASGVALIVTALATWQTARAGRKQTAATAAIDANKLQLDAWNNLLQQVTIQLNACIARETEVRQELSGLRTRVIALEKIRAGEWPNISETGPPPTAQ